MRCYLVTQRTISPVRKQRVRVEAADTLAGLPVEKKCHLPMISGDQKRNHERNAHLSVLDGFASLVKFSRK